MSELGADSSLHLQRRYEAMRRWWCTGDGDSRDNLGLAVLLHQGMRVWMGQADAESRKAAVGELVQPPRVRPGDRATIPSTPLHSEVARLLAVMAIGTIETREQTA